MLSFLYQDKSRYNYNITYAKKLVIVANTIHKYVIRGSSLVSRRSRFKITIKVGHP